MSDAAIRGPVPESDFSFRKMKLATIILIAQMFATSMLPFLALTLVMVPITTEFGWTATEFSLATTALMWCGAITAFGFGAMIDRVGVRALVILGTVAVGLVTIALSYMTGALWQFLLCFALLGVFGSSAIGYAKIIAGLFTQHRGKALAIIGVESTLAGAGIPPLVNYLIATQGWRGMYFTFGLIILAVVPILYFTIDEPGEINSERRLFKRRTTTAAATHATAAATAPAELEGLNAKQILRDRIFWLIVIATIIGSAPRSGMMPYFVPMLMEKGFTQNDAAYMMSISTLIAPLGTLIGGFLVDKIQTPKIAFPFQAISFAGLFVLFVTTSAVGGIPLLMLSVALSGFSLGTARPMGTYFHVRMFGLKAFGFYTGFETALLAGAMGIAAPAFGLLHDRTGSYDALYIAMLVTSAIGALVYLILGPYRYRNDIGQTVAPPPAADDAAMPARAASASI